MLIFPEIVIAVTGFVLLLVDLFLPERRKVVLAPLALAGIVIAIGGLISLVSQSGELMGGRFSISPVTTWFKIFFLMAGAFTIALVWSSQKSEAVTSRGEFFTILLFTQLGMMFLISARELITLYISLELSTIPLFALAAWKHGDMESGEAGLKYVVYGALASALLLYGLGLLYGITGQFDLAMIRDNIYSSPALWLAVALIIAGIGFKLTLTPFHMWAADVYQGAPTPVTAYLSVASKAAGLAFMFQLFFGVFGNQIENWQWLVALLATATMTLGNLVAIVQNNIKRFMAFSAISQAGYLILGFLGPYPEGPPAMLYYLLVYIFTNIAVFAVIIFYSDSTGRIKIEEYRGLSRTNPLVALTMALALFGLAGIPPLSGFVGKFFLFSIAAHAGMNWLVAVAAINSTVSLYYYLRIVREMYIEPPYETSESLQVPLIMKATLAVSTFGVIFMGIIPFFYDIIFETTSGWISVFSAN
jgi:NADH-quinone oxidoreductase subunit N